MWQACSVHPFRRADALRRLGRRDLRRAGRGRRYHRNRCGTRCCQPRPEDRPRRKGRLRVGDVVQVVQDDPWRHPLSPATRVPPGLREPGRTPTAPEQRAASGQPAPVSHPALRPRRRRLQDRGPLVRHRPVAVRPDRRLAHRETTPRGDEGRGAGPPAHAQHRPPRGRVPLLRRTSRRCPADPDRGTYGGVRVRRRPGQLHPRRPPDHRPGRHRRWRHRPRRGRRRDV